MHWECIFQSNSQYGVESSINLLTFDHRLEVAQEARALKRKSNADTLALLTEKRMKLQLSIDDFHRKAATYMPTDLLSSIDVNEQRVEEEWEDAQYDSEEDDILPTMPGSFNMDLTNHQSVVDESTAALSAEHQCIRLPSSFGRVPSLGILQPHGQVEFDLRKGQANDALHSIRLHVAEKSFLYGVGVRKGATTSNLGHRGRQKTFNEAHALEAKIRHQARIYECARKAMETLGMSVEDQQQYPKLLKADTNASTAVVDFNARGQRNEGLSWIWRTPHTMPRDSALMSECRYFRNQISVC